MQVSIVSYYFCLNKNIEFIILVESPLRITIFLIFYHILVHGMKLAEPVSSPISCGYFP